MNKKALLVLPLIVSLLSGCPGKNNNNVNKHVTIGMDKKEVMKLLGDPNFTIKDEGKWYYFDSDFTRKYDEMNKYLKSDNEADIIRAKDIYEELEQMHFTYQFVHFSMDDKAIEYFYDTNHHYDENHDYLSWDSKTETSLELENFSGVDCYKSGETYVTSSETQYKYEVKYSDSSMYRGLISPIEMTILKDESDGYLGKWRVNDYREFSSKINVNAYDGYVNVQYDKRRSSISGIGYYNQGDTVTLTSTLSTGYTTEGWCDAKAEKITDSLVYTFTFEGTGYQNYIYLATPIRYTITYNLDGGINSLHNPTGYTIETTCDLYSATREGYSFLGWYDNNGNKVESIEAGRTGDLELTARWEAITYKVTYLDENNNVLFEGTSEYADGVLPYPYDEPTKAATDEYIYEFKEWKLLSNENYHYTYQVVFNQISKAEKKQQMIEEMNTKVLNRLIYAKDSNDNKNIESVMLSRVTPNEPEYPFTWKRLSIIATLNVTIDGETVEDAWSYMNLMIDDDTYEEIKYLYYKGIIGNEYDPLDENYTFDDVYNLYNCVFKNKDIVIYNAAFCGEGWKINCPELPNEDYYYIRTIEADCYEFAHWYNANGETYSTYYGDNDWDHNMYITSFKMIDGIGDLWHLEVKGKMKYIQLYESDLDNYMIGDVTMRLEIDSTWMNKIRTALKGITFDGEHHFSEAEGITPEVLMHIANGVNKNDTRGVAFYFNGTKYTPGEYYN